MQTQIPLIATAEELAAACRRLSKAEFVTVDTEFMRETTYWPRLCLIQMASLDEALIVDPLAEGMDLQPFFDLMANQRVMKVFHAARQDIEIVHNLARIIPEPVFDTQVAAMVCGFGESVSYGALVQKLLHLNHDKTSRFTDWSHRPLSERQLTYAVGDVTHLRGVYVKLKDRLEKSGRAAWLAGEMAELTDFRTYEMKPEDAWRRLKMRVKSRAGLAIVMELAAWRESEAKVQDVPRGRIIKDEAIYDVANQAPRNAEELGRLRTIHEGFARSARGRSLLAAVQRGLERETAGLPELRRDDALPASASAVIELLRVLLKAISAKHDVAPKLIARSEDLEKIALNDEADVPALQGWRRDLFGQTALALKHGKIALALRGGKVVALPVATASGTKEPDDESEKTTYHDNGGDGQVGSKALTLNNDIAAQTAKP